MQLTVLLALLAVEVVAALAVARLVVAGVTAPGAMRPAGYQAWLVPQWGQPTEVETSALKA